MRTRLRFGLVLVCVCFACGALVGSDENKSAKPTAGLDLSFTAKPAKIAFAVGEDIVFRFRIKNLSSTRMFVSRYMPVGDFVALKLLGPDGKQVTWQGKIRSVEYNKDAFLMLEPGKEVSANHTISTTKGEGFVIDKPGRYTVQAEYSLGPPEYFGSLAPKESIPRGTFNSPESHFTVTVPKEAKP
ncbi:MAG: hypothetical protein WCA92_04480 [Terriglobales bacterium]|jgi:hypothetical protein